MAMNQNTNSRFNHIRLVNVADDRAIYDPDLPNANAVMAAICCVSVRYAANPSMALAILASDLSHQLMASEYAESQLVIDIAQHLATHWDAIVDQLNGALWLQSARSEMHH